MAGLQKTWGELLSRIRDRVQNLVQRWEFACRLQPLDFGLEV
jgi:hypothetical protein